MPVKRFHEDYNEVKSSLAGKAFEEPIKSAMKNLGNVLGTDGPRTGSGSKLDRLRVDLKKGNEAENILKSAGLKAGDNTAPSPEAVQKVACVKFLRHMYLEKSTGAQNVWVHSSPKAWDKYTWEIVKAAGSSSKSLETRLKEVDEFFVSTERSKLAEATQMGCAWVHKTLMVLAEAKQKKAEAKALVERWFAPAADKVDSTISALEAGFKKIQSALKQTNIVLTDHPPERGAEKRKLTEAYVLVAAHKPKTIYIEQALAKNFNVSVLHDMKKNWARVIVHECSHLEVNTADEAYAYKGIKPGGGITAVQALNNADSWAFFAADCGGALIENDRTRALGGTLTPGFKLTEQPGNWN